MKRKLPMCAWCGKPLARTTYRTIEHEAVPGRPIYGWHWGKESPCDQEDGEGAAAVLDQAHNDGRLGSKVVKTRWGVSTTFDPILGHYDGISLVDEFNSEELRKRQWPR